MFNPLKLGNKEALKKTPERSRKLIHQPVSQKVVDLLIEQGKREKITKEQKRESPKRVAINRKLDAEF